MANNQVVYREVNGEVKAFLGDTEVIAAQPGGQQLFLSCNVFEALFTGNRGGGKSHCLLMDFVQSVGLGYGSDWKGIVFRQTYPQLQDIVSLSKKYFGMVQPDAKFNEAAYRWRFPGGEELMFRHCASPNDYYSYHGWQIPWLGFEELTTWADSGCYLPFFSICRTSNPKCPRKIRATTNPYGPGHGWVKARFQLPIPPGHGAGKIIIAVDEQGHESPPRVAIRSDFRENKIMLASDKNYMDKIRAAARNESELLAWIEGSWDIVSGGMFDDVWNANASVVPDLFANQIPRGWRVNRAYDHGQSRPFSVGWWAESNGEPIKVEGRNIGAIPGDLVRLMEWYGCYPNSPNEGLRLTARDIALGIRQREQEFGIANRVRMGIADSSIFDDYEPGRCVAGDMRKLGVVWMPIDKGPNSRSQGWQQMRQYMKSAYPVKGGAREHPGLFVCKRCTDFTRTVPVLPRDLKKIDDVDTTAEDHIGDEVRYRIRMKNLLMSQGSM